MDFITIFLIAVGVSMDAFAVALCKGLAVKKITFRDAMIVGIWFGGFQVIMPAVGYLLGTQFQESISSIDHWIAFILLSLIGLNMIRESLSDDEDDLDGSLGFKIMLLLALATSIDALAVGISFAFLSIDIIPALIIIGVTTFTFSVVGMFIGGSFGVKYKSKAEFAGGLILILLGIEILLEHLSIL